MLHEWVGQSDAFKAIERGVRTSVGMIARAVNRRRFGRLHCDWLACDLGHIVDISAGGMRIWSPQPLSGQTEVRLRHPDGVLTLRAEVIRCWPLGKGRHEVGLRFLDPEGADLRRLCAIATSPGMEPPSTAA